MKALRYVLAVAVLLAAACAEAVVEEEEKSHVQALSAGNNRFAVELYAKLKSQEGNLFFSPYSISTALAMTWAGARGETETQMAETLRFNLSQEKLHPAFKQLIARLQAEKEKKGYELSVANALWGQEGYELLDPFLKTTRENYGAEMRLLDFVAHAEAARRTINKWVEKETRGKIKDLIPKGVLSSLTRLVLTNAIYFKGDWDSPFEKKDTRDEPFKLLDGKQVNAPMMHQTEHFGYAETDDLKLVEMPYAGRDLSMVVLLPKADDGLPALEKSLTLEKLTDWMKRLRAQEVVVAFPRFKLTSQFSLGEVLGEMGMPDAFDASKADFSGMTGNRELFISAVVHKAYVDVNEEGTEAAAATGVVMQLTAVMQPKTFRADHPFLFLIRDRRTYSILFLGRVVHPGAGK